MTYWFLESSERSYIMMSLSLNCYCCSQDLFTHPHYQKSICPCLGTAKLNRRVHVQITNWHQRECPWNLAMSLKFPHSESMNLRGKPLKQQMKLEARSIFLNFQEDHPMRTCSALIFSLCLEQCKIQATACIFLTDMRRDLTSSAVLVTGCSPEHRKAPPGQTCSAFTRTHGVL